jgi:hypothetical protein
MSISGLAQAASNRSGPIEVAHEDAVRPTSKQAR